LLVVDDFRRGIRACARDGRGSGGGGIVLSHGAMREKRNGADGQKN